MSIPETLTFEEKNEDDMRVFTFKYQTAHSQFKLRVFGPEEWSTPQFYDDLANGVYANHHYPDKPNCRTYEFSDVDGGAVITLSKDGTATFKMGQGSSEMKFSLPFQVCQAAFKEAAKRIRLPLEEDH